MSRVPVVVDVVDCPFDTGAAGADHSSLESLLDMSAIPQYEPDQGSRTADGGGGAAPCQDLGVACRAAVGIDLAPLDGLWTQAQYLALTDHGCGLLEFSDGRIEVLPMPTDRHQVISRFLFLALFPFLQDLGGTVLYAPLRLRIRDGKFREPDLLLVCDANDARRQNDYWRGADVVIEVVSPDDPVRDTEVKRLDYAEARVPEYWIVNPVDESVMVLVLEQSGYVEHGAFRRGQRADSVVLDGFSVAVAEIFDAR